MLPVQESWVQSLVWDLDPTCNLTDENDISTQTAPFSHGGKGNLNQTWNYGSLLKHLGVPRLQRHRGECTDGRTGRVAVQELWGRGPRGAAVVGPVRTRTPAQGRGLAAGVS